jgi:hypothetical protein
LSYMYHSRSGVHDVTKDEALDTAYLDTVTGKQESTCTINIHLEDQLTEFKVDTGAEVTAISEKPYKNIQTKFLLAPSSKNHPDTHLMSWGYSREL